MQLDPSELELPARDGTSPAPGEGGTPRFTKANARNQSRRWSGRRARSTKNQNQSVTKISIKSLGLIACLGTLPLMVGLTGCAGDRNNQGAGNHIEDSRTAERGYAQKTDQGIEDSRTAERVREALAAGADYKYDAVSVSVRNGVVQLSGFVNATGRRNSAGELASKVVGVSSVENNLTVKD